MQKNHEKLRAFAKDLRKDYPRSPRELLAGYVIAARVLDKCRAFLAEVLGDYKFDSAMDRYFFDFTGIEAAAFRDFVATGASDEEVAAWVLANARQKDRIEVIRWNNRMRETRIGDLPEKMQLFLEDAIPDRVGSWDRVRVWFDLYDIEEKRV